MRNFHKQWKPKVLTQERKNVTTVRCEEKRQKIQTYTFSALYIYALATLIHSLILFWCDSNILGRKKKTINVVLLNWLKRGSHWQYVYTPRSVFCSMCINLTLLHLGNRTSFGICKLHIEEGEAEVLLLLPAFLLSLSLLFHLFEPFLLLVLWSRDCISQKLWSD